MSSYFIPRWSFENGVVSISNGQHYGTTGNGLSGISVVESNAFRRAFVLSNIPFLDMGSLETVESYGMFEAFLNSSFSTGNIHFSSLKTIKEYGMYMAFQNSEMNEGAILFGVNLESIGSYGLYQAFMNVTNTYPNGNGEWNFNKLTNIADSGMYSTFASSELCTIVKFGALEEITTSQAMYSCFDGNTKIVSAQFPALKRVTATGAMKYAFKNCKNLTSVTLPMLEEIAIDSCATMFSGCTGLTSVSLPSIDPSKTTITGTSSSKNALYRMFYQCKNITALHFPASLSSYSNYLTKAVLFGGTSSSFCNANLQILFDL